MLWHVVSINAMLILGSVITNIGSLNLPISWLDI